MAVSTFYSTPGTAVSGYALRGGVDQTLTNIRAGAGTGNAWDTGGNGLRARLTCSTTTNQFSSLYRGFCLFDTSALPDTDTISAAQIELYVGEINVPAGAFEIDIVASTPASNVELVNADYAQTGTTVFSSVATGSMSVGVYAVFALNASGIAAITQTGISKFGVRVNWDTDNSFGGSWGSGRESSVIFDDGAAAGTGTDPKLVVTHAPSSAIKTVNGLAKASVGLVEGLAIASVKNINGLA